MQKSAAKSTQISKAIGRELAELRHDDPQYVSQFVDLILKAGQRIGASDLHLQPTSEGLELRYRLDGVLQLVGTYAASHVVARLKVLADLLTYHTDVPQEGRIRIDKNSHEMRLSTFPTLHGERAVVRIFSAGGQFRQLDDLGLPSEIRNKLDELLGESSGLILVTGPAGSGKTTTLYACLGQLVARSGGGRSLATIEDPIESAIAGASQSQVNPAAGFDLAKGLRSLMRQDPEVIMVGEVRDRPTAEGAFQASLTGQLVLSSFHAGSACGAISRLSDMGIEPYLLRSGVLAIICQRLVRRLCRCAKAATDPAQLLGLPVEQAKMAVGCDECAGTGYSGRFLLAEMLLADRTDLGRAILSRSDAAALERLAVEAGMITCWQRAFQAVEQFRTSPEEVRRVLGFSGPPPKPERLNS